MTLSFEPLPSDFVGAELTVVGLGVVDGADLNGGGAKRIATMPVSSMIPDYLTGGAPAVSICYGDSGGPAFADVGGVQSQVGITRSHFNDCLGQSQFTRIDTYADEFLIPIVDAWSGPCAFDGTCVTTGCRTPDPDCAPCGIDNVCSTGCDTADPDCPLGGLMFEACSDDEQCESRRCLSDEFGRGDYCSQRCESGDCPFGSTCQSVGGEDLCVQDPPPDPIDTGGCTSPGDSSGRGGWLCALALLALRRRRPGAA